MKRFLKRIVTIIICIAFVVLVGITAIYNYIDDIGRSLTVDASDTVSADCIIVPGAGVKGNSPSIALAKRLDKAMEVYNLGHTSKIIVSGDHGQETYDEVNVMRDYLVEKGIPQEDIFMDHAGFSTYETLYRARDVFEVESAIIVTQTLHLRRALYIGKSLSINCQGVAADNSTKASTRMQSFREYPARVKAFFECEILHPKPKFLGEAIPISGSGIETEG